MSSIYGTAKEEWDWDVFNDRDDLIERIVKETGDNRGKYIRCLSEALSRMNAGYAIVVIDDKWRIRAFDDEKHFELAVLRRTALRRCIKRMVFGIEVISTVLFLTAGILGTMLVLGSLF